MIEEVIRSIFQFFAYLFALLFGIDEPIAPFPTQSTQSTTPTSIIPSTETTLSTNSPVQRLYNIDLFIERRFESTDPTWGTYFESAKERWEEIIVGDIDGGPILPIFGNFFCDNSDVPNFVDDIFMCAVDSDIDGQGGILGAAGPVLFWPSGLTAAGDMTFDFADINNFIRSGQFEYIVLHEMGHIIGMGTLWRDFGLNDGESALYTGANAIREWEQTGCTAPLKVETDGSPGTRYFHWDEDCMRSELMTGRLDRNAPFIPISRITGGSLQDMGYEVDMSALDEYDSSQIDPLCCFGNNVFLREPDTKKPKPQLSDEGHFRAQKYAEELAATRSISKRDSILSNFTLVHKYEVIIEEGGEIFLVDIHL